jgi:hypothetical protein
MAKRSRPRSPFVRLFLLILGVVIIIISPIVGAIPGPGGIFVFAAGLVLVLQNSAWARRQFARHKRRSLWVNHYSDMALRRPSFRRRQARLNEEERASYREAVQADFRGFRTSLLDKVGLGRLFGNSR